MNNYEDIRSAVLGRSVQWRRHALQRMMEREISRSDVFSTIESGEVIESDVDQKPFPTYLWFATIGERPMHVVTAWDRLSKTVFVVTAYEPDQLHFENNFRTRRQK